jgi:hypothetical protein
MMRDHLLILRSAALFSAADAASTPCCCIQQKRQIAGIIETQVPGADILRWMGWLLPIVDGELQ